MTAGVPLPLDGVRVIEIGQLIAVPGAGQQLLQLGADVIKIEPPGGEPARRIPAAYAQGILRAYNRGKRSIELDLKDPSCRQVAEGLIAGADVVLHNLRPGTLERLGLGTDRLRQLRPDIISVCVSGFGANGPSARRAGLDIAAQAESGLMSVTGEPDGLPQRVGSPVIDHITTYVVTQAVLAALLRRNRDGCGADIRVPLLDVAIHLQTPNWVQGQVSGTPLTRTGNGQPSVAPAADVIRARDGEFVVSGYQPHAWARLCEVLGRPDLAADPRFADNASRVANRRALVEEIQSIMADRSAQDAVDELAAAGVVAAVVRRYDQVLAAEDVIGNEVFVEVPHPDGGSYHVPAMPYRAVPPLTRDLVGPIPELNEMGPGS